MSVRLPGRTLTERKWIMGAEPVKQYYRNVADTLISNLEKRQMEGYYCETSEEAVKLVLSLMPAGSSVGWGGSETLTECGLMDALKKADLTILDRKEPTTEEGQKKRYAEIFGADFFLMGTNAITLDGELVNIDSRGNRVSYLCYGPENVVIVTGMNKIVSDVESGIRRIHDIAAPPNAVRLNRRTPCAVTGRCGNCLTPDCLCSQTVVTRFSYVPGRIKVVLIGETLGY